MRILVFGSRDWSNREMLHRELDLYRDHYDITEVIHGDCRGADRMAGEWAEAHGIPVTAVPAEFQRWGYAAGPLRNKQMARMQPDIAVGFRSPGKSTGTDGMALIARRAGIPTKVVHGR